MATCELETAYLKFLGQVMDFTAFFVVKVCVRPQKLGPFRKSAPALEVADACRIATALDTQNFLLKLFQRQGIGDDSIVVSQRAGWQINKRLKVSLVPIA